MKRIAYGYMVNEKGQKIKVDVYGNPMKDEYGREIVVDYPEFVDSQYDNIGETLGPIKKTKTQNEESLEEINKNDQLISENSEELEKQSNPKKQYSYTESIKIAEEHLQKAMVDKNITIESIISQSEQVINDIMNMHFVKKCSENVYKKIKNQIKMEKFINNETDEKRIILDAIKDIIVENSQKRGKIFGLAVVYWRIGNLINNYFKNVTLEIDPHFIDVALKKFFFNIDDKITKKGKMGIADAAWRLESMIVRMFTSEKHKDSLIRKINDKINQ
jgi:hypothetical protein